jgi:hypothetical protein
MTLTLNYFSSLFSFPFLFILLYIKSFIIKLKKKKKFLLIKLLYLIIIIKKNNEIF